MIVCDYFPEDGNELLKNVQHDEYSNSVLKIFQAARGVFVEATQRLDVGQAIAERVLAVKSFDHRVLQNAHDIIAAFFRCHLDAGCPDLPEVEQSAAYLDYWREWLDEILEDLMCHEEIVRGVLHSVIFTGEKIGATAEYQLCELLALFFDGASWMDERHYQSYTGQRVGH